MHLTAEMPATVISALIMCPATKLKYFCNMFTLIFLSNKLHRHVLRGSSRTWEWACSSCLFVSSAEMTLHPVTRDCFQMGMRNSMYKIEVFLHVSHLNLD